MQLKPYEFNYKNGGKRYINFIAEDVEKVNPLLVAHDSSGQPFSIESPEIVALLVDGYQKQQKQIEQMNQEINLLKAQLAAKNST